MPLPMIMTRFPLHLEGPETHRLAPGTLQVTLLPPQAQGPAWTHRSLVWAIHSLAAVVPEYSLVASLTLARVD